MKGYVLATAAGAVTGGIVVARVTKAIPKSHSQDNGEDVGPLTRDDGGFGEAQRSNETQSE